MATKTEITMKREHMRSTAMTEKREEKKVKAKITCFNIGYLVIIFTSYLYMDLITQRP